MVSCSAFGRQASWLVLPRYSYSMSCPLVSGLWCVPCARHWAWRAAKEPRAMHHDLPTGL